MIEVDARGLSCPEPALMAMEAIVDNPGEEIRVLVSNATQKQNIAEVAEKRGRNAVAEQIGEDYAITIK